MWFGTWGRMQSVSSNILLNPGHSIRIYRSGFSSEVTELSISRKDFGFNLCVAPFANLRVLNFRSEVRVGIFGESSERESEDKRREQGLRLRVSGDKIMSR